MVRITESARSAARADIAAITELASRAIAELAPHRGGGVWSQLEARTTPLEAGLLRDLDDGDASLVVGTIDDAVVGYSVIRLVGLHDGRVIGSIDDIYVMPEARGVGVGEAMIGMQIAWAGQRNCAGVDSVALPGDRHTKNFFETHGLVARSITVHREL